MESYYSWIHNNTGAHEQQINSIGNSHANNITTDNNNANNIKTDNNITNISIDNNISNIKMDNNISNVSDISTNNNKNNINNVSMDNNISNIKMDNNTNNINNVSMDNNISNLIWTTTRATSAWTTTTRTTFAISRWTTTRTTLTTSERTTTMAGSGQSLFWRFPGDILRKKIRQFLIFSVFDKILSDRFLFFCVKNFFHFHRFSIIIKNQGWSGSRCYKTHLFYSTITQVRQSLPKTRRLT